MNTPAHAAGHEFSTLLRGEIEIISAWIKSWSTQRCAFHIACIVLGSGLYGAAMGWWHSPQQGLYVAIKFPLIMLLTAVGNALINGMLAPQLGLNISFRQSFSAVLMSFTISAAILGAFSPLVAFMVWNAPPISPQANFAYAAIMLAHVFIIAFAGSVGNARLFQLLERLGSRAAAFRVLFAWLATNLFLGSQLSWILRPFIGSPNLPVEFVRTNAFHGNFYETFWGSILQILRDFN